MGTMTCVECSKNWYEKGPSNNTICDDCAKPEELPEEEPEDFEDLVRGMMLDEELAEMTDLVWDDVKMLAAEYVVMQLRWKMLVTKKGSVE
ncbi:hypothetical protein ACM26V_00445 [Salipaludibacillus sp. HK11]|uniref:hypothetical protein n=1 Tax=Salipaludibacillus sp. HK11 TaxID=3394320 RepID=UPI0039FCE718